jgi:hypothetical protein
MRKKELYILTKTRETRTERKMLPKSRLRKSSRSSQLDQDFVGNELEAREQ